MCIRDSYTAEPVTVYPGDKNNLPYDVVVERLHVEKPEQMCIRDRYVSFKLEFDRQKGGKR